MMYFIQNTVIRALKTNNEIEISNESEKQIISLTFAVENGEEKGNWLKYLVQHTKEHYKYVVLKHIVAKIYSLYNCNCLDGKMLLKMLWKYSLQKLTGIHLLNLSDKDLFMMKLLYLVINLLSIEK